MASTDFLALDDELDEVEQLVAQTTRRFVDEKFLPVVVEHFEAGTFPSELIPQIGELGLLGMHLDGYGCAGMSGTAYGTIVLHAAPEAALGGGLALVESGDTIELDVAGRRLELLVDA
ncbi:MAG: dihydroxy-acid dehydratase, partial [Acidimicrobiales bacterium]